VVYEFLHKHGLEKAAHIKPVSFFGFGYLFEKKNRIRVILGT
jgi:hypothetical protein